MVTYLTTTEAAEWLGLSPSRVRSACAAGRVPGAEKVGRDWQVPARYADPEVWRTEVARKRGRKREQP